MNESKWVRTIPLSMVSLASLVIAANLSLKDKPYGWFVVVGFILSWWTAALLEKIEAKG